MKEERFWNVDLKVVFWLWLDQIWVFLLTALTFFALSMPVVIPTLILWYLSSVNFSIKP